MTKEMRLAYSGRVCITASKDFITDWFRSDATGNLFWQACTENLVSVSMSSPETPMTVAPSDLNSPTASAKKCASAEQPSENAAGKKYRTTGPFFRESASE